MRKKNVVAAGEMTRKQSVGLAFKAYRKAMGLTQNECGSCMAAAEKNASNTDYFTDVYRHIEERGVSNIDIISDRCEELSIDYMELLSLADEIYRNNHNEDVNVNGKFCPLLNE